MLRSLAEAWVHGAPVAWPEVLGSGPTVDLPTYPFQRRRYCLEAPPAEQPAAPADESETAVWAAVETQDLSPPISSAGIAVTDTEDSWEAVLPPPAPWRRAPRRS
ncbi:hypothetical protein VM98_38210, partial [Streptomyces rubellomurinus subsp. indigoferus]